MLDYIPLTPTAGRRLATLELRDLATERMRGLGYAYVGTEVAPARAGLRFDVVGVARWSRQVRIYEVKSSRGDFVGDAKMGALSPVLHALRLRRASRSDPPLGARARRRAR